MNLLARLFSALTLVALICAIWVALLPQRPTTPDRLPSDQTTLTGPVDRILIEKSARKMTAFRDGAALKTYRIALGFAPEGDKSQQGDGKTPEGIFRIDRRNDASAYHLSLGIDYPQAEDRARAAAEDIDPGGDIFIHGQPNQLPRGILLPGDWTAGCIAISNAEIGELFAATAIGTEVEIRP
ncbi:L,D-transpeptidase family protein [Paracoccus saliphilus]|uniref:L,D-transpeptidase n=1 Tax=Paracoccus saliphilus TaxID=405559 RepID=A0AA45W6R7_9RHOB|nr:L,D-transpeptidase [Paracoccus saliphilus]WCR02844.1 L,D-transpeptidase [Paracoccus saliphilus]SIT03800.1 L,D-transpeptidase catalytic domain [Paracoccus saliphilus]